MIIWFHCTYAILCSAHDSHIRFEFNTYAIISYTSERIETFHGAIL